MNNKKRMPVNEGVFDNLGLRLWTAKDEQNKEIKAIPTGSILLNKALGVGGWPEGKMIELFGSDSSGKTTLALHAIREAQKINKTCVYIDLENTLNPTWATKIQVDTDKLFICYADNGEHAFSILNELVKTGGADLIVVDSVAAMVPAVELSNNVEDQTMGLHARLMSKGLRILQSNLIGSKTTIIFINQIREKIGSSFIPMTTTTGGRALKYAASTRVEIKRMDAIKNQEKIVGFNTKATVVKNKYGSPMQHAVLGLYFDSGFDSINEIIAIAVNNKIIEKNGSWYSYKGKNICQGSYAIKEYLMANPAVFEEISKAAKALI